MLAAKRTININGKNVCKTPIMVPSISSKGFPNAKEILETVKEVVADSLLISAYDLYYDHINSDVSFPELLFVDSGGYECSEFVDYSEIKYPKGQCVCYSK